MLWWLAQHLISTALLAGVIALACRFGRLRPATRHALWLLVLIKLLVPPVFTWTWPGPDPLTLWQQAAAAPIPEKPVCDLDYSAEEVHLLLAAEMLPCSPDGPNLPLSDTQSGDGPDDPSYPVWLAMLVTLGVVVWVGGSLVVAGLHAARVRRFRDRVARAAAAPEWLDDELGHMARRMRVRAPSARVLDGIATPMVWSLGRTHLLWPELLIDCLPARCRAGVLVHELAHLRRRDHWVGWLLLIGVCLFWWNPLYWYIRRQIYLQAELACDAWVLDMLPGDRRAYAEALIEVTQWVSQAAVPMPAVGMGARRQDFERRLTMIMREQVPCRLPVRGLLFIGTLAVLALPGWTLSQAARAEDKKEEKQIELRVVVGDDDKKAEKIADGEKRIRVIVLDPEGKVQEGAVAKPGAKEAHRIAIAVAAEELTKEQMVDLEKKLKEVAEKLKGLDPKVHATVLEAIGKAHSKAAEAKKAAAQKQVEAEQRVIRFRLQDAEIQKKVQEALEKAKTGAAPRIGIIREAVEKAGEEAKKGGSEERVIILRKMVEQAKAEAADAGAKAAAAAEQAKKLAMQKLAEASKQADTVARLKLLQAAKESASEKDRIAELEKQLKQLMEEVARLKAGQKAEPKKPGQTSSAAPVAKPLTGYLHVTPAPTGDKKPAVAIWQTKPAEGSEKKPAVALFEVKPAEGAEKKPVTGLFQVKPVQGATTLHGHEGKPAIVAFPSTATPATRAKPATPGAAYSFQWTPKSGDSEVIALTQATYKLPAEKAKSLAKFIGDNLKAPVLKVQVSGDSLVVVTTPQLQTAISQLVGAMQEKTEEKSGRLNLNIVPMKPLSR